MLRKAILAGISIMMLFSLKAQDPYFSQSFSASHQLNPALIGAFDGSYRIGALYRSQWNSYLEDQIASFSAEGDVRFQFGPDSRSNSDIVAGGVSFLGDRAGVFEYNTNQIHIGSAFHKLLDKRNRQYISGGVQLGVIQHSLSYSQLQFQDQFNGIDRYNRATGEPLPPNNLAVFDLNIGVHYTQLIKSDHQWYSGAALFHLTSPNVSFYGQSDEKDPPYEQDSPLDRKWTAYTGFSFEMSDVFSLIPRVVAVGQGKHMALSAGTDSRLEFYSKNKVQALHLGAWVRNTRELDGIKPKDFTVMAGFEINAFLLSLSYDASLDALTVEAPFRSSFELGVRFLGAYENDFSICPSF